MIESDNKKAFNSRASIITSENFWCLVSTAKEGFFKGHSTMFLATNIPGVDPRPCAKVIYADSLNTTDRLNVHGLIINQIDELGKRGMDLSDALEIIFLEIKNRGIAKEAVNLM